MILKKHPIFWSILFAIITLIAVTLLVAEILQPFIFFSLFIAIPLGIISSLIIMGISLVLLKRE